MFKYILNSLQISVYLPQEDQLDLAIQAVHLHLRVQALQRVQVCLASHQNHPCLDHPFVQLIQEDQIFPLFPELKDQRYTKWR